VERIVKSGRQLAVAKDAAVDSVDVSIYDSLLSEVSCNKEVLV